MMPASNHSLSRVLQEYHRDPAHRLHLILRVPCSLIRSMDQHSTSGRRETLCPCREMSALPDLADSGLPVPQHPRPPADLIRPRVTTHTLAQNAQRRPETWRRRKPGTYLAVQKVDMASRPLHLPLSCRDRGVALQTKKRPSDRAFSVVTESHPPAPAPTMPLVNQ